MPATGERTVEIRKNVFVRLRDGIRLAADLYLPAGKGPFPALVSSYPYHKDDYIGVMCALPCRFFADHGYASVVVDFRGTGGSEGLPWEPFDPGEQDDGADVVEWVAAEPWCDGNVGMWGISYGAIASLQAAARRPPHLRAIAVEYGCTDAYADFVYPGGAPNCLSAWGSWASLMLAMNLMPPTYADTEGRWRRVWHDRLGRARPYALSWKDHPAFDDYWRAGVIAARTIDTPALLIGGWRELFPEAMTRIFGELSGPKKMFVGPWTHMPADFSFDFEPMDHLAELLRWWDHWLKGERNGVTDEPRLAYFVQGTNEWRQASEWPPRGGDERTFFLSEHGRLAEAATSSEDGADRYSADPTVGATAGLWELMSLGVGRPLDQGPDDLLSLTYTSEPLEADAEILDSPELTLHVGFATADEVQLVAKLNDVDPAGGSTLITTGWLKVERRAKSGDGEAGIRLWATAYRVASGHRLRLSLSCSDFPRIFPTTTNPTIQVFRGDARPSRIRIPCAPAGARPGEAPLIRRPDPNRAVGATGLLEAVPRWRIQHDLIERTVSIDSGLTERFSLPTGGEVSIRHQAKASVAAADPASARVEAATTMRIATSSGEDIQVETTTRVGRATALFTGRVTVDGRVGFEREWGKG